MSTMFRPREQLRRALFLNDADRQQQLAPMPVPGTSIYYFLRRQPTLDAATFNDTLLHDVAGGFQIGRPDLGYPVVYQYHNVTTHGWEVAPFKLLRSYPALRLISGLWDAPTPPAFRSRIRPYWDAMIELRYETPIEPRVEQTLRIVADRLGIICSEVSLCECDRRYGIIKPQAGQQESVFLTVLTRTPWNRTPQEAQRYWINEHAKIVAGNVEHAAMSSYEQAHTTVSENSSCDNTYNGVAMIGFPTLCDYLAGAVHLDTVRFNNALVLDEMNLTINSDINLFRRYHVA